nr:hypothetical protein [Janthinobacterium sp. Marseille]
MTITEAVRSGSHLSSIDFLLAAVSGGQNFSANLSPSAASDMSDYGINEWL